MIFELQTRHRMALTAYLTLFVECNDSKPTIAKSCELPPVKIQTRASNK